MPTPALYRTLISAPDLRSLARAGPPLVILDCGFDLTDPQAGERAYAQRHVAGACYAHLDEDLSGAKTGSNGRHPLPERAAWAERVGRRWGIGPATQVVAYDSQGGSQAARAWWLMRWLGHEAVAVLDGGLEAWMAAGGAVSDQVPQVRAAPPYPAREPLVGTLPAPALQPAQANGLALLDARSPQRFRGEIEPLDPVAGHIPGAMNRFFKDNLGADGCFKPADVLRTEFAAFTTGASGLAHYCGSGVTACHNILAMTHCGLEAGALYPGSWSEWCSDPARPVARA